MKGPCHSVVGVKGSSENGFAVALERYVRDRFLEERVAVRIQGLDGDVDILFIRG